MNKPENINSIVSDVKAIIEKSRENTAVFINETITALYWQVGRRIRQEILNEKRAEYGKEIIKTLSAALTSEFGNGLGVKQLRHYLRFAETFQDVQIVYALRRQLSWTHIRSI